MCSLQIDRLQLGFDGREIGIEQIIEQAALIRTQLFTAFGELVPLEDGDLMRELLVDRFKTVDFVAHRVDLGQKVQGVFGQGDGCSGVI